MEEVIGSIPIRSTKSFQQLSGFRGTHFLSLEPKVEPKTSLNSHLDVDRVQEFRLRSVHTRRAQSCC